MSPVIILMVVVFPAPFGPRSPKISPESTEKSIASTALMSGGYAFTRFSTTTAFNAGVSAVIEASRIPWLKISFVTFLLLRIVCSVLILWSDSRGDEVGWLVCHRQRR